MWYHASSRIQSTGRRNKDLCEHYLAFTPLSHHGWIMNNKSKQVTRTVENFILTATDRSNICQIWVTILKISILLFIGIKSFLFYSSFPINLSRTNFNPESRIFLLSPDPRFLIWSWSCSMTFRLSLRNSSPVFARSVTTVWNFEKSKVEWQNLWN